MEANMSQLKRRLNKAVLECKSSASFKRLLAQTSVFTGMQRQQQQQQQARLAATSSSKAPQAAANANRRLGQQQTATVLGRRQFRYTFSPNQRVWDCEAHQQTSATANQQASAAANTNSADLNLHSANFEDFIPNDSGQGTYCQLADTLSYPSDNGNDSTNKPQDSSDYDANLTPACLGSFTPNSWCSSAAPSTCSSTSSSRSSSGSSQSHDHNNNNNNNDDEDERSSNAGGQTTSTTRNMPFSRLRNSHRRSRKVLHQITNSPQLVSMTRVRASPGQDHFVRSSALGGSCRRSSRRRRSARQRQVRFQPVPQSINISNHELEQLGQLASPLADQSATSTNGNTSTSNNRCSFTLKGLGNKKSLVHKKLHSLKLLNKITLKSFNSLAQQLHQSLSSAPNSKPPATQHHDIVQTTTTSRKLFNHERSLEQVHRDSTGSSTTSTDDSDWGSDFDEHTSLESNQTVQDGQHSPSHCSDQSSVLESNHSGSQDSGHSTQHSAYSTGSETNPSPAQQEECQAPVPPPPPPPQLTRVSDRSETSDRLQSEHLNTAAQISQEVDGVDELDGDSKSRFLKNRLIINSKLENMFKMRTANQNQNQTQTQSQTSPSPMQAGKLSPVKVQQIERALHRCQVAPSVDRPLDAETRRKLLEQQRQMSLKLKQKPRRKSARSLMINQQLLSATSNNMIQGDDLGGSVDSSTATSRTNGSYLVTGSTGHLNEAHLTRVSPTTTSYQYHHRQDSLTKQLSMICLRQASRQFAVMEESTDNQSPGEPTGVDQLAYCRPPMISSVFSLAQPTPISPYDTVSLGFRAGNLSLRQLVKEVIDDCERPARLSTNLTKSIQDWTGSSSSDLATTSPDSTKSQ